MRTDNYDNEINCLQQTQTLNVQKSLDFSTTPLLISRIDDLDVSATNKIRIDFSECGHIDSSGLGFLLLINQKFESFEIVLEGMSEQILEKLKTVHFDQLFRLN